MQKGRFEVWLDKGLSSTLDIVPRGKFYIDRLVLHRFGFDLSATQDLSDVPYVEELDAGYGEPSKSKGCLFLTGSSAIYRIDPLPDRAKEERGTIMLAKIRSLGVSEPKCNPTLFQTLDTILDPAYHIRDIEDEDDLERELDNEYMVGKLAAQAGLSAKYVHSIAFDGYINYEHRQWKDAKSSGVGLEKKGDGDGETNDCTHAADSSSPSKRACVTQTSRLVVFASMIIMEYGGISLHSVMQTVARRKGTEGEYERRLKQYIKEKRLCAALRDLLDKFHSEGFLHYDLSTANVLLHFEKDTILPRLTDFDRSSHGVYISGCASGTFLTVSEGRRIRRYQPYLDFYQLARCITRTIDLLPPLHECSSDGVQTLAEFRNDMCALASSVFLRCLDSDLQNSFKKFESVKKPLWSRLLTDKERHPSCMDMFVKTAFLLHSGICRFINLSETSTPYEPVCVEEEISILRYHQKSKKSKQSYRIRQRSSSLMHV